MDDDAYTCTMCRHGFLADCCQRCEDLAEKRKKEIKTMTDIKDEDLPPLPIPTNIAKTAPEHIWLVTGADHETDDFPSDHEGVLWCEDQIDDTDVSYIRADLVDAQRIRTAHETGRNSRKPLSEDTLCDMWEEMRIGYFDEFKVISSAIEAAHNIKD